MGAKGGLPQARGLLPHTVRVPTRRRVSECMSVRACCAALRRAAGALRARLRRGGVGTARGVWGVGARVGVRADVLCVNLCPRTHELHVRGLRVRGSLAAKSRSVGEVSGTRLCRGAWQTSHCTGSCRSAQGQPPGERQGISICERSRVGTRGGASRNRT